MSSRFANPPPLGLLVFFVGAASLGAEIAAARLMAPFFGASTIVWANTIGIVLVALSIGYWVGGRFADRHPSKHGLCVLVLIAAVAVALIPFAADPFLDASVSGTRRTFLIFALACALVAVTGIARRRALAVPVTIAAVMAMPVGTIKAAGDAVVLEEIDSEYQYARAVEYPDGQRELELNEGEGVHSLYKPASYLTGNIWDEYLVLPFAALERPPRKVAILGNAAGTTARALGHYVPATEVHGVEIDAELTRLGRKWFDMRNPRLEVFHEDARPYLRRTDERYDVIMVDAYRQPYIPFYLTTKEFFELTRDRLRSDGVVIVNANHFEGQDELEKVLSATLAEVFPTVLRNPAEDLNTLLLAAAGTASPGRLSEAIPSLPRELRQRGRAAARRLAPRLPGGTVYTDDKAPVEWLIDKSIVREAAGSE